MLTDRDLMRIEAEDFRMLMLEARDFDKKLYAGLRKQMRLIAEDTVADVRAEIGRIPSSGRYRRGLRASLARGTRASITMGNKVGRGAGVRVTTSSRGMPAKAMNLPMGRLRHPVFKRDNYTLGQADAFAKATEGVSRGKARAAARRSWKWVQQDSRPYFGITILKHQRGMRERIVQALDDAAKEMAREVEN